MCAALPRLRVLVGSPSHLSHAPDRAVTLYHGGQSAVLHHDLPKAIRDFSRAKALAGNPDREAWAQYQLASVYAIQPSKKREAVASLQTLIREYPHHFLAARAQEDIDRLEGRRSKPIETGKPDSDCGPECLAYLLQHSFHRPATIASLRRLAWTRSTEGTSLAGLQQAGRASGLTAEGMKVDTAYFRQMPQPTICWVRRSHFVAVTGLMNTMRSPFWAVRVYDPTTAREEILSPAQFAEEWDGYVLALSKTDRESDSDRTLGSESADEKLISHRRRPNTLKRHRKEAIALW